jgi:hypothetical protein
LVVLDQVSVIDLAISDTKAHLAFIGHEVTIPIKVINIPNPVTFFLPLLPFAAFFEKRKSELGDYCIIALPCFKINSKPRSRIILPPKGSRILEIKTSILEGRCSASQALVRLVKILYTTVKTEFSAYQ